MPYKNKEDLKKYYIKNKDKIKIYKKRYRQKHKEYCKEYEKEYRRTHKEKIKKDNKKYRTEHKEQIKENRRKWSKENKEYSKKYRNEHKEYIKKYRKEYCKTENGKAANQRGHFARRAREREIINNLTFDEWLEILKRYSWKCAYCGIGFDLFNRPERDHIIPISKGGNNTRKNIVPACRSCNAKKHNKILKGVENFEFKNNARIYG